jgi:hypothetical protein
MKLGLLGEFQSFALSPIPCLIPGPMSPSRDCCQEPTYPDRSMAYMLSPEYGDLLMKEYMGDTEDPQTN